MAELQDPAGNPIEVEKAEANTAFAAAMADDREEPSAPPKRQPREPESVPKRRSRPGKAERARTAAKASSVAPSAVSDDDRADGVRGLVQIGAGVCLIAARVTGKVDGAGDRVDNPAYKADAVTLASSADQLAGACVETAKHDARFAAVLDRVCAAGPYGALITAVFGVGTQMVRNHRPSAHLPGTVDPAEILRAAERQERLQEAA